MFHRRLPGLAHIHISECLVWQGPEHAAHADVPHQRCRSSGQGGGELLHATSDVTGLPKKTVSKDKSGHGPKVIKVAPCCTSLFYGRTQKKLSTEGTVKYSMAQLKSGRFNILSQRVAEDLCLGEDSG